MLKHFKNIFRTWTKNNEKNIAQIVEKYCFIFVKHNERSFEAVDILTASNRSVWKKDERKLFHRLSKPKPLTEDKIKSILGLHDKRHQDFMDKRFDQNKLTREVKLFLQEKLNVKWYTYTNWSYRNDWFHTLFCEGVVQWISLMLLT